LSGEATADDQDIEILQRSSLARLNRAKYSMAKMLLAVTDGHN
jgi:hypothetical protein